MPGFLRGLVLAGALVLAGCGVGAGDSGDAVEQPKVTKAQLAAMVLSQAELGTIARGLKADEDRGPVGNAEAADATLDPEDTGKSVRSAGRLGGHKVYYGGTNLVALRKQRGVFLVGTEVELLEDTVYAAQYLHKQLSDFQRFQGKQDDGSRLAGVSSFQVPGVGDEAEGLLATSTLEKKRLYLTAVAFRRERIIGIALVARADKHDAQGEARALAVKLDKRIQGVLAGEIQVEPEGEAPGTKAKATGSFQGRERLPALTVARADVAGGARLTNQGRTAHDDYVGFHRVFEDVRTGGSHLVKLRAETRLYRTKGAATAAYRHFSAPPGRKAFARELVASIADETGVAAENVAVRRLPGLGHGYTGVVVTFTTTRGAYRFATVFMRSGRTLASVTGFCTTFALDPSDMKPLARRARTVLGDAV